MSEDQMKSSWNVFGCSIWQFNKEINADIAEGWIAMHQLDVEMKKTQRKEGKECNTEDMTAYTMHPWEDLHSVQTYG